MPIYNHIMKNLPTEFLEQVKTLFDQLVGSRDIAKQLGCTRHQIQKAYKELGLDTKNRHKKRTQELATEKCCKIYAKISNIWA